VGFSLAQAARAERKRLTRFQQALRACVKKAKMAMRGVFPKKHRSTLKNADRDFFRNATPAAISKYRASII
jgi:hypothetical protein